MSNCKVIVMLDLLAQLAYWWAKMEARKRYGSYVRKTRICDPEAFAHPAEKNFEMGLFVSQNFSPTNSNKENAILWRRWYGGDEPETTIYEYVVNPEILSPEVFDQLVEVGKEKFMQNCHF